SGGRVQPIERGFRRSQPPFPVLAIEAGQHLMPVTIGRFRFESPRTEVEPPQRLAETQEETPGHNFQLYATPQLDADGGPARYETEDGYSSSIRFRSSTSWARSPSSLISCSTLRTECSTVVWSLPPKRRPISGSEREVRALARYIAIWRGRTTSRERRELSRSFRATL